MITLQEFMKIIIFPFHFFQCLNFLLLPIQDLKALEFFAVHTTIDFKIFPKTNKFFTWNSGTRANEGFDFIRS